MDKNIQVEYLLPVTTVSKLLWLSAFLIGVIFILYIPSCIVTDSHLLQYKATGPIGDSIGGTMGPIVALLASILTFWAFWVQYQANKQQKKDLQIERFENKFYQMVQIHRDNVSEILIGKSTSGRKAFIAMFSELKFIYLCVSNFYNLHYQYKDRDNLSIDVIYNIAYLIFFFGYGPNSSKIINDLCGENTKGFILCLEEHLNGQRRIWRESRNKRKSIAISEGDSVYELNIVYKPFNGHMSKLSHYIRHIYQLVKYVDENYPEKNNYTSKYQYITTLRSQLSTFEQLIIYYNALSVLGQPWLEIPKGQSEFLLKKYCLIKSMPITFADFYKKPKEVFGSDTHNKNGIELFEWEEIKKRLNRIKNQI